MSVVAMGALSKFAEADKTVCILLEASIPNSRYHAKWFNEDFYRGTPDNNNYLKSK